MKTTTSRVPSRLGPLTDLLTDPEHPASSRLLRLQGWRDADLAQALAAGWATRIGPAVCGALGLTIAVTGSAGLAAVAAVAALVGSVARNHPIELVYNRVAVGSGWVPLPPNRAAKRFACLLGGSLFTGSAVGFAVGAHGLALGCAVVMTAVPLFVAASGVCVPSLLFTLLWGVEAATAPTLPLVSVGDRSREPI